jgi:protein-S-isoprenylcysteine O-methyltransferase Ste14
MTLLAGWFVYWHLVPESWKEWRAAGILHAFLTALYAELYGFPLTVYLLTAYFNVDHPWLHIRGHLWSSLLGLGDSAAVVEMLIGYAVLFLGIGLLAAGWRQIYLADNYEDLVSGGIYRYIRHPQYTGIFVGVVGQLIHWPTIPTLALAPLIIFMYRHLAITEELQMARKFGLEYLQYAERTPRFFPKLSVWQSVIREAESRSGGI